MRTAPSFLDLLATKLVRALNLSDLTDPAAARTNLGLGTAATAAKVAAGSVGVLDAELVDPDALTSGESSMPRSEVFSTGVPCSSGSMRLRYFTARKTETINNVRLISGGTAAGATPTLVRFGLYTVAANGNITLVASTPNDTTLLAAPSTAYTKALSAPYAKVVGQRYAAGLLVVTGATVPTVIGQSSLNNSEAGQGPKLGGVVSGQTDLPASVVAASIGDGGNMPYLVVTP